MPSRKILLVDDDIQMLDVMRRYLENHDFSVIFTDNGSEALMMARDSKPDLVVADVGLPGLDGFELCKALKGSPGTARTPVIIISGGRTDDEDIVEGYDKGADDFVSKPFNLQELTARIESASRRARRMLAANPLTFLAGGPAIEDEAAARIKSGEPLAFFYMDIDNFKAYNDNYGYLNGDNAIKQTASILAGIQADFSSENVFIGHIGGDDFVMMCAPGRAEEIAHAIAVRFDALAPRLYNRADAEKGAIVSKDRMGNVREFPLMSLTISVATNENRELDHYAKIVDIVSEIKKYLKGLRNRSGSLYLKDRRVD